VGATPAHRRRARARSSSTRGQLQLPGGAGDLGAFLDLLGGDSPRSRRFLGGIVMGALVGAAIAGSSVLRRRPSAR